MRCRWPSQAILRMGAARDGGGEVSGQQNKRARSPMNKQ